MAEPLASLRGVRGIDVTVLEHVVESSTRKRRSTKAAYRAAIRSFIEYLGPGRDGSYTGADVERWRDALVHRGLAPRTVNCRLAAIKFASKRLDALDLGRDFARAVEFLPVVFEKKRFAPSIERGRELVAGCNGLRPIDLRDRALIVVALRTGCRREGLAQLQISDVERDTRAITVVIKGGRRHKIHLDAESRDALEAWLRWLARFNITDGPVFRSLRERVTGWEIGAGMHPTSLNVIFNRRAARGGAGHWYPHLARHAFCSWADSARVPRTRIAAVTGHRNLDGLAPYLSDIDAETDPVAAHLPSLTSKASSP